MSFGDVIVDFFGRLQPPAGLPGDVDMLWPYGRPEVQEAMSRFYTKYFSDGEERIFLVGINPGRFGAGVTGICFTDPLRLAEDCGISPVLKGGRELSSDFVYRMIAGYGGPAAFYRRFYLTALSPVGFVRSGRNLNYYDVPGLPERLDEWMARNMKEQLAAGACREVVYSLGQGANFKHLEAFNRRHGFFKKVVPLPHPRWVMQYRRKHLDDYLRLYVDTLASHGARI